MRTAISLSALALFIAGCASAPPRPVLYPNAVLQRTGPDAANTAIAACMQLADAADLNHSPVARDAGAGAVVGGAGGAAVGAVFGHPLRGLVAGAVGGAASGAARGAIRGSEPSPLYRNYVNRCLRDKGYDVIGWR